MLKHVWFLVSHYREKHNGTGNIPLDKAGMLAGPEGYRRGYDLPIGSTPHRAEELAETRKQILLSLQNGNGEELGAGRIVGTLSSLPLLL